MLDKANATNSSIKPDEVIEGKVSNTERINLNKLRRGLDMAKGLDCGTSFYIAATEELELKNKEMHS